ncbi:MAG: 16S rRNA (uracil(1498)-N(3))-methyltransferase [Pseudomonadota bacterium]
MQSYHPRTRLFVDVPLLKVGEPVALPAGSAHYLRAVLRANAGDIVELFNGRSGAFAAEITALGKSGAQASIKAKTAEQETLPKLALAFAPLKKERTQFVTEKATELGAARIIPMLTARTQGQAAKQLKMEKLRAYAIEACEQCGRTGVPEICQPLRFVDVFKCEGVLVYADEIRAGEALSWPQPKGWTTLLIGPEGGWSPEERAALQAHPNAYAVSLGPRILRAETAAMAMLTLWQTQFGDICA